MSSQFSVKIRQIPISRYFKRLYTTSIISNFNSLIRIAPSNKTQSSAILKKIRFKIYVQKIKNLKRNLHKNITWFNLLIFTSIVKQMDDIWYFQLSRYHLITSSIPSTSSFLKKYISSCMSTLSKRHKQGLYLISVIGTLSHKILSVNDA